MVVLPTISQEKQLEKHGGVGHGSCSASHQFLGKFSRILQDCSSCRSVMLQTLSLRNRVAAAMERLAGGLQPEFILSLGAAWQRMEVKLQRAQPILFSGQRGQLLHQGRVLASQLDVDGCRPMQQSYRGRCSFEVKDSEDPQFQISFAAGTFQA